MAKSKTTNISIRMDTELKTAAEALFDELGMNLSTAFNIFVRQSLREGGIPFQITNGKPNKETIAALLEAEKIAKDPKVKGYKLAKRRRMKIELLKDVVEKLANGEKLPEKYRGRCSCLIIIAYRYA